MLRWLTWASSTQKSFCVHPPPRWRAHLLFILRLRARGSKTMEVLYERCAGIDVHKKMVKVCLLTPGEGKAPQREIRTYATTTPEVLALRDWLKAEECPHIAMESTGVYWKPLFNLLENDFAILVVNAQHLKTIPGRKTDVKLRHEVASIAVERR